MSERHLQRLDVLELVGVPLFDLPVLPRREEKMSLGDKLEEHDTAGREREREREVRSELETRRLCFGVGRHLSS